MMLINVVDERADEYVLFGVNEMKVDIAVRMS